MIEHSADITKLAVALHKVQGIVHGVVRDSSNPGFKGSRYASLEAVIEEARPALQQADLSFTQAPGAIVDGAIEITTMLIHTSGQWMRSTLHVPLTKKDAQGVGSAITYGSRYSLMAALGMPPVDDDGEAAVQRPPQKMVVQQKTDFAVRSTSSLVSMGDEASSRGTETLTIWGKTLTKDERAALGSDRIAAWKRAAAEIDRLSASDPALQGQAA